jgi:enoyl-CoA hydratase/carnithine racemase
MSSSVADGTDPSGQVTHVLYSVQDRIATITMNEPEQLNPISHGPGSMQDDIVTCMLAADRDPVVRCIVVTGAGRAFSSGGSFSAGPPPDSSVSWYEFLARNYACNAAIRDQRKPVIGAINGLCYGTALIMSMHFDFLVADESAKFGLIETRFGSTGVDILPYLVGPMWAKFLALTGELITAQKAKDIGLVLDVFPTETFHDKVYDLARRIAAMPADGVVGNRKLVNMAMTMMGAHATEEYAVSMNAVTESVSHLATSSDGVNLAQALGQSWEAFKEARDKAFLVPWLEHESD